MTGRPFSADALVTEVTRPTDDVVTAAKAAIEALDSIPEPAAEPELDCRLRIVHGTDLIVEEGKSPREVAEGFRAWILGPAAAR